LREYTGFNLRTCGFNSMRHVMQRKQQRILRRTVADASLPAQCKCSSELVKQRRKLFRCCNELCSGIGQFYGLFDVFGFAGIECGIDTGQPKLVYYCVGVGEFVCCGVYTTCDDIFFHLYTGRKFLAFCSYTGYDDIYRLQSCFEFRCAYADIYSLQ
jgi:hypothetical protein